MNAGILDRLAPQRPPGQDAEGLEGADPIGAVHLPRAYRYALLRTPRKALVKPVVYATLADLVAALHRDRKGEPIELVDAPLLLRLEAAPRDGVNVYTLAEGGTRHRYLGWCWIGGGGRESLEAALFAACPDVEGWGAE